MIDQPQTAAPRRGRLILLWTLAAVITLASVAYQRMTGPTYPMRGEVVVDGATVKYRLPTSQNTTEDAEVRLAVPSTVSGEMRWRRVNSDDPWHMRPLVRNGNDLLAMIPRQPAAGKVAYYIVLTDSQGFRRDLTIHPVVIRFKDPVPAVVLWPHIVLMFAAMLVGTRCGIEALAQGNNALRLAVWTSVLLFVGGLILGPIVQKYAFGAYWTGWPFGKDLTDNKTAVAMIMWLVALWRGRQSGRGRLWFVVAAVVHLLVYLIPHSMFGSELDFTQVEAG